ncbi:DUF397 domain-containing protein [Carbonactinospora thermoautotrophica]|uniref:DUF397 domain-containing protein n=1 Tax=Carbonactinospora thermoautotrophica TaxID=1469144 RepID=UPI00227155C5|nr:DUF397 domain-containing protein [Carbonactinospora thermoautotrophica]MCX9191597.1 DUF397 domain-containing protein [Carbonactinospora thermoautotrophica]
MTKSTKPSAEELDLADVTWHKSRFSNLDNCVEVAKVGEWTVVRDSMNPDGPKLVFTRAEWEAFTGAIRAGQPELL